MQESGIHLQVRLNSVLVSDFQALPAVLKYCLIVQQRLPTARRRLLTQRLRQGDVSGSMYQDAV
jgi:hypothetical protein